ncbi:unnamed protein product [Polarella glacialis]|uniref:Transmembrane protein 144 n=1 Tax=Polarella glacialis TaxID=89957 RepID=A0A813IQG2_POLGL|nr:unnamed protein product [Polarella glacialis]
MGVFEGYASAAIAVLLFGSNFTVVAKYDPGDGMFFQLVLCLGIWCTGLLIFLIQGAPTFYPFALLGGVLWSTGNCATVFIIKTLGLGPGLITWGTVALIIGWLTGFFGLFGIPSEQDQLQTPWLNVLGFVLSLCALVDSAFVTKTPAAADLSLEKLAVLPLVSSEAQAMLETYGENESERESADARVCENARKMAETGRRASGMLVAVVAGCFFGVSFLPSTWIMHHIAGASQDGLDYVFNQFCGILLASVFYFLAYCAYKNNRPAVNPEIILPGFVSGVMWAIGQACC